MNVWSQISESFESGLPTAYIAATSFNLSSGIWTGQANGIIQGTIGINSGKTSLQLRSQTGAQITTPNITAGVGTVTFWGSASTASGSVQVNYSIDGGVTWIPASNSPFSLTTGNAVQKTATINSASPNILVQFYRTAATVYIDDVDITIYSPTSNSISTGTIAGSSFCAGASVSVPFTSTGTFNAGNVYAAELSNAAGSFVAPVNIGSLASTVNSGTIAATIPLGTAAGNGYRIRVVSNDPSVNGSNNGANLTVNVSTSPTVTSAAASVITASSATLNGNVTGLGSCSTLAQEKGFVYALNTVNANPTIGGTGVTKIAVATAPPAITTGTYTAPLSGLSSSTAYSYKSYVYDGTNYIYGTVQTFTTLCGTPTPSGAIIATKSCGTTALVYNFAAAEPATGVAYYWQTTSNGISFANPVNPSIADPLKSDPYVVATAQTYYIRGHDGNCWGAQVSSVVTVDTMPSITTQPTDKTVEEGSAATFNVGTSTSPTPTKQWQIYDTASSTWINVGANSVNYSTGATVLADEGKQYRVIVSNGTCQVISNAVTLHVSNKKPGNASISKTCIGNNRLTLSWTAPTTGATPTGYIVFALPGTTVPSEPDTSAGNASAYLANSDYSLAISYGTSGNLGKAVYKGSGTSVTVTGLTQGSNYTFKVVAYNGENQTGWASGINSSGSWNQQYTVKVPEVGNPAASVAPTSSVVTWNVVPTSAGCYEYMVVASQGSVTLVPSGDGSAYSPVTTFAGNNQVVYKGTGNPVTVTGLTEGVQYCYKIFVREVNSNQWSSGAEICKTTGLSYCSSTANVVSDDDTGITNVKFNTINNTSSGTPAYTDFTGISTDVVIGEVYDLSVKVNTLGDQNYTKAWIDWNRNGTFESNEVYDLGDAYNGLDEATALSPLAITVPSGAAVGLTRMRIATQYFYYDSDIILTPCQTGYAYGEVEDYTINITRAAGPEINIKGANINIPSGSTNVMPLNNTLFASTLLGNSTAEKDFTIENLGLSPLLLTGTPAVVLTGDNPSDFTVTLQPAASVAPVGTSGFKIKFNPTTAGVLRATVSISNNDITGNENPYTFTIQGTGTCSTIPALTVLPTSGPANTVVTISSTPTDNLTGATVKYNGVALSTNLISPTQMEVTIPAGAENDNLLVRLATGCVFTQPFTVITKEFSGCEAISGTLATDLILYEVYDENGGSGGYMSIYNGTASSRNLANYEIFRSGTSTGALSKYTNGLSGNILPGELKIIRVAGANNCSSPASTGNGVISSGYNDDDKFQLTNAAGTLVYDEVQAPNYVGYYMKRAVGKMGNHPTYTPSSWTITPVSANACLPGGVAPAVPAGNPPQIIAQPQPAQSCKAKFSVAATEGIPGGYGLAYQWYMLAPGTNAWTPVTDNAQFSGANTSEISVLSGAGLNDYQFYCQVREDGATCYRASNAVQFKDVDTTWNGTSWTKGIPTPKSRAIIAADYDTAVHGSFEACTVTLNANYKLNIKAHDFVTSHYEVINLSSQDNFTVESDGNLIQVNDNASNSGSITVKRNINVSADRKQYNYLISPVVGANLKTNIYRDGSGNPVSSPSVQYHLESSNYFGESSGAYIAGRGLAVKEPLTGVEPFYAVFAGPPTNGAVTFNATNSAPSVIGPGVASRGYNLIGNPYPSNLDLWTFYTGNGGEAGGLSSTFRFWDNHNNITYDQQGSNYSGNSYASYNVVSATGTAATSDAGIDGSSKKRPGRYVSVGQGFMTRIIGVPSKTLKFFNNSRTKEFENDSFFGKGAGSAMDRYWLKMVTPDHLAVQMAVVYFAGGSNGFGADDSFSSGSSHELCSISDGWRVGINGRSPFVASDKVPLGSRHYVSGSYTIALDHAEGIFAGGQAIYLKDNQTGAVTNLSEGGYSFTANAGETSSGRFEIIYEPQTVLATGGGAKETLLVYRDGTDFVVKAQSQAITGLEVYDGTGRLILKTAPNATKATIDSSVMVNGVYMLKIDQRGKVTTKKVIK